MGNPAPSKTMIYVLLDRSGSMSGLENDVIGGINNFLEEQKKNPNPAVIAFGRFDTAQAFDRFRPMMDIQKAEPLNVTEFKPRGGTPLLDATGLSIQALEEDWKRERPDRCIFVTFTDGHENASTEFTKSKIKSMVESREKSGLWNFLFLGAGIDAFDAADSMGYKMSKAANYTGSGIGTRSAYGRMSQTVGNMRSFTVEQFSATAAGIVNVGMGGNIAEDGTLKPVVGDGGSGGPQTIGQAQPPAAQGPADPVQAWTAQAEKQAEIKPPTSSALFDSKVEAWTPPV